MLIKRCWLLINVCKMDHSPSSYSTPPPSLEPQDQEGSFWPTDASSTFRCSRNDLLNDSEGGNTITLELKILEKDQMTSFVMDLPKVISLTLKLFHFIWALLQYGNTFTEHSVFYFSNFENNKKLNQPSANQANLDDQSPDYIHFYLLKADSILSAQAMSPICGNCFFLVFSQNIANVK